MLFLNIFGGGGVNIIYHNIDPPSYPIKNVNLRIVLSVICKCFVSKSEVVTGFHLQNSVLEYFWRGGGQYILP